MLNTGESDVTILQHMCYAVVYVAELSSRTLKSLLKRLVPKDSSTWTVFTLFICDTRTV